MSIEEMQDTESVEYDKAEACSSLEGDIEFENPIDKLLAQDMDDKENSESVKVECCVTDERVVERDMEEMNSDVVSNDVESSSESESESESETSSSASASSISSSASSACSESDDDEVLRNSEKYSGEQKDDGGEGEIMDSAVKKMVSWSENDDDEDDEANLPKGHSRSKNELHVVLPPVPQVTASLQSNHQLIPVGVISSVLGTQVIVEGSEMHNPLSEGSILWLTKRRLALGIIDEIFGPVKTPYYIVRYNSESEVPADIQKGTTIGFVPEFVDHVLNDKNLYQKGYDASGENDEEICDETEFSDDEKEAEYRRMLKTAKRENNNKSLLAANKKKDRRNVKRKEKIWTNNQPPASQCPTAGPSQPTNMQQQFRPPSSTSTIRPVFTGGPYLQSLGHGNQPSTSSMGSVFLGWPNMLPQMQQSAPPLLTGNWGNGMPPHHQIMAMSSGFQVNPMPWLQQNHPQPLQMPSTAPGMWQQQQFLLQLLSGNLRPPQQQFDLSQLATGGNNFNTGTPNSPWPGMLGSYVACQSPFTAGIQNPNVLSPMFPGFVPNGPQPTRLGENSLAATNFPANDETSSQTRQGVSWQRSRKDIISTQR